MVLPGTLSAALVLLFFSLVCFGLWPNAFKLSGARWRFQLFSIDFAVGGLLCCLLAAYTLGTMGADLGFTDSMLVAGQREEAVSVLAGVGFAFANMCFLATVALIGLAPAALLAATIFGCGVAVLHAKGGSLLTSVAAIVLLGTGAVVAAVATRVKQVQAEPVQLAAGRPGSVRTNIRSNRPEQGKTRAPIRASTKGLITGILSGLGFIGILPLIWLAQPEQLGIGAYGGMLLASAGMLAATFFLNFFFFNIQLESVSLGYGDYFSGSLKDHVPGIIGGVVWAAGALAFYAAQTGAVPVGRVYTWIAPLGGAVVTALCGVLFWRRPMESSKAGQLMWVAVLLMALGVVALLV